uniref:Mannosyltransferase n=1 Tax=Schistosoma curassoni TaxID=6186 RepID=A0A183JKX3_9TREM
LYSLGHLITRNETKFVTSAGIAILVFRSELILLFGPCLLYGLFTGSVKLRLKLLKTIITTTIISIGSSVLIDSLLWGRLIWPEFEVFYFNTILNKSGQWGVSFCIYPFHWYFTSALPKSLLSTYILLFTWIIIIILSIPLQKYFGYQHNIIYLQSNGLLLVGFIFVGLYSFLPHKELRFIIYILPIFNLVVADIWAYLEKPMLKLKGTYMDLIKNHHKLNRITKFRILFIFYCYIHLLVNILCSIILIMIARKNYPGGEALTKLNHMDHLIHRTVFFFDEVLFSELDDLVVELTRCSCERHDQHKLQVEMKCSNFSTYDSKLVLYIPMLISCCLSSTCHCLLLCFGCIFHWFDFCSYVCAEFSWLVRTLYFYLKFVPMILFRRKMKAPRPNYLAQRTKPHKNHPPDLQILSTSLVFFLTSMRC